MSYMIDANYQVTIGHVTSTAASGIENGGNAEVISAQINPTISGAASPYATAIIQGSNDGSTWFTGASGTITTGVPLFLEVKNGTAGQYRLRLSTSAGGIDADCFVVTKREF